METGSRKEKEMSKVGLVVMEWLGHNQHLLTLDLNPLKTSSRLHSTNQWQGTLSSIYLV